MVAHGRFLIFRNQLKSACLFIQQQISATVMYDLMTSCPQPSLSIQVMRMQHHWTHKQRSTTLMSLVFFALRIFSRFILSTTRTVYKIYMYL